MEHPLANTDQAVNDQATYDDERELAKSDVPLVQKQKDAEREGPMHFNLEKVADSLVLRPTVMADAASRCRMAPGTLGR